MGKNSGARTGHKAQIFAEKQLFVPAAAAGIGELLLREPALGLQENNKSYCSCFASGETIPG